MPSIELIGDPDYLNQKLLNYITTKENLKNSVSRKFSHAQTYEDFIKMIKTSTSAEEIKQFHSLIMNQIMQATIISDFKSIKQNETVNLTSSSSINSGIISSGSSSFYVSFSDLGSIPEMDSPPSTTKNQSNSEKQSKIDLLRSRNLKKYLKQLRHAQLLCKRRLNGLNNSVFYGDDSELTLENKIKNRKVFYLN